MENLQIDFHLKDKKKGEIMDVLIFVVLSHLHILAMLLPLRSTFPPFWNKRL